MNNTEKGKIGEEFVNKIAYQTFLKYWCYPDPKDENDTNKHQICDLLILFENIAIIIEVKNYEFKNNYNRYFKSTIVKALRQIHGAERRLFGKNSVAIKHPDREKEVFKKESYSKIYRLIVNLGEGLKFYYPSLYTIGDKHVTIMDKNAWLGIINELDTIADLVRYLDSREQLFQSRSVLIMPGEEYDLKKTDITQFMDDSSNLYQVKSQAMLISGTENDLLALYIKNNYRYPETIDSDQYKSIVINIDGEWDTFIKEPQVIEKKKKDQKSYFIDENVRDYILKNPQNELLARKFFSLSRFERRVLTNFLFEFYQKAEEKGDDFFSRGLREIGNKAFVLIYHPLYWDSDQIEFGIDLVVDSFLIYKKYKFMEFLVICTTFEMDQFKFGYTKYERKFTSSEAQEIMKKAKSLGWFSKLELRNFLEREY